MNGEDWEDWSEEEIELDRLAYESHRKALAEIQELMRQPASDTVMAMRSGVQYWVVMIGDKIICMSSSIEELKEMMCEYIYEDPFYSSKIRAIEEQFGKYPRTQARIIEFGDWPKLETNTKEPPVDKWFIAPCSKLLAKTVHKNPRRFKQVLYSNLFPGQQREESWPVWLDGFVCTREELWKLKKLLKTRKIEEITPF